MPQPITLARGEIISILTQLGRSGTEERYVTIRLNVAQHQQDVVIPLEPGGTAWDTLTLGDSYFISVQGPIPPE